MFVIEATRSVAFLVAVVVIIAQTAQEVKCKNESTRNLPSGAGDVHILIPGNVTNVTQGGADRTFN